MALSGEKIISVFIWFMLLSSVSIFRCSDKVAFSGGKLYSCGDSMMVDNLMRTWYADLPPNYYETANFPLILFLHGTGGSAEQCARDYNFTTIANSESFVVIYPEGVKSDGILGIRTWNAGTCCNYASEKNIDDVHFLSVLIDKAISDFKVDPQHVYITGISNGAMMAYRIACQIPEKITAIAPVSGTMMTSSICNCKKTIPILHIHSSPDSKVPPAGGIGLAGYYYPPVDSVLNVWSVINNCNSTETLQSDLYTLKKWKNSENETIIEYYLTKDGGHAWPGGVRSRAGADAPSAAVKTNELIIDFFKRNI